MKIRTKLVVLASVMVAIYTMGLLGMLTILTFTRFLQTEYALAQADLDRAVKGIKRETENLGILARDYAQWDDTWNFARGNNPQFAETNFTDETWENTQIGFIALYDFNGRRLYSAFGSDPDDSKPTSPLHVNESPSLMEIVSKGSGFYQSDTGLLLCHSSPISKSNGDGPSAGTLIMGKKLDAVFFQKLSDRTGVPIDFFHDYISLGLDVASIPFEGDFTRIDPSGSLLHAYKVFWLHDRTPAFILQTSTDRSITTKGNEISLMIIVFSCALAIVTATILKFSFWAWVNRPLIQIEEILVDIDLEKTHSGSDNPFLPLGTRGNEIGRISSVLSELYVRLGKAYDEIRNANENLEREVSNRTASLSAANRNLALYGKILESTSEGVIVTDLDGNITDVNDAMCIMAGYSRQELIGRNPRLMKSDRHDTAFYRSMWSSILSAGHWSGEVWDRRRSGEIYPKWLTINAIYNDSNAPEKFVGISTDITKIKQAEAHLHQLAFYDPLTGLPNRSLFSDRLEHAIARARRENGRIGLLFLDLDRFKNINDTLGHAAGDCLLVKVATRIKSRVRETDTVCRIGGDEFTVILDRISREDDAGTIAGSIINTLSDKFDLNGTEIYAGTSIGIALFPKDGLDSETLVKKADTAMYVAKESGRGKWFFASGEMDEKSRHRMETESRLRGALERNEFALYYQPQTSAGGTEPGLSSGLLGAEALIRWIPEDGVIIGPAGFIDIAEEIGIIVQIGEWVLGEACREAKNWSDSGKPIQVSVNVSTRQFEDGKLPETVARVLAETGLPPRLLKLEVTESMFMRNMEKVIDIMALIRQTGVMFSIDDFGTGYSSLQYLNRLPVDSLKIDKAFVSALSDDLSGGEIVTAVISMARAFGLTSIAEGVETVDQLEALCKRGCDEIQGYLVSEPICAREFREFMSGL